jgi:ABC-type lipoprotein release transport system permease subunit
VGTLESLWVALDTLRTHKLRSFLTMLGVIFGVMAVVVMVALIEGARASVMRGVREARLGCNHRRV